MKIKNTDVFRKQSEKQAFSFFVTFARVSLVISPFYSKVKMAFTSMGNKQDLFEKYALNPEDPILQKYNIHDEISESF